MGKHKKVSGMLIVLFIMLFACASTTFVFGAKPVKVVLPAVGGSQTGHFYVGCRIQMAIEGVPKKRISWSSSKSRVASVSSKGVITARHAGKATITGKYKKKKFKFKAIVLSDKKYVAFWAGEWARNNINPADSDFQKVLTASRYVTQSFAYGKASNALDVLLKGKGTCYSGGLLLAEILKSMGYDAKIRFAANDNMARYPKGLMFMSEHYNVRVIIQGNVYYVDGTPNSGVGTLYLSSETEPLYFAHNLWGTWVTEYDRTKEM